MERFVVKVEVNHSTDFNEHYPEDAVKGESNYSGGKMGSEQPFLVYVAEVDLTNDQKEFIATLKGHGSPDGSDGEVYPDLSGIISALSILKSITIRIKD